MSNGGISPFARHDGSSSQSLLWCQITTTFTFLLLLVTSWYYAFTGPNDGYQHGRFWHHNIPTPFAQNSIFTSIYWIVLFLIQLFYLYSLHAADNNHVVAAVHLSSHFVANNLLLFSFVQSWVRGHYWLAELLLVVNFFNLTYAYLRHPATPRWIHIGALSGPLAWNFVALYWAGAVAVDSNHLVARIVANVMIWAWLGYGLLFLAVYKDYTMGLALSTLSFSTAVGQFLTRPAVLQLQWIFAFAIGGLLFIVSLAVCLPSLLGRHPFPRGRVVPEEQERAPLLADD